MDALRDWLSDERLPAVCARQDVIGAALLENDLGVSNVGWVAAGNEIPADQKVEWLILVDATTPAAAAAPPNGRSAVRLWRPWPVQQRRRYRRL